MITPQQIVAIGLRLFAIFLAYLGLRYLVTVPISVSKYVDSTTIYASLINGVVMLVLAAVLWMFPLAITHKIIPRTRFENHLSLNTLEAARVGCCLIGLWVAAEPLPSMLWFILRAVSSHSDASALSTLSLSEKLTFLYYLAQLALGIFLLIKADWFASFACRPAHKMDAGRAEELASPEE